MTSAEEASDMNSHATRKLKASAASTTKFMPARNAGEKWQRPRRLVFVAAIANSIKARIRAPDVDDREEKASERIHAEMRANPRQPERQGDVRPRRAERRW